MEGAHDHRIHVRDRYSDDTGGASVGLATIPVGEYTIPANGCHETYTILVNTADVAGKLIVKAAHKGLQLILR